MTDPDLERALTAALRRLPREVQPQRDLWPGIAYAIQAPGRSSGPRTAALAASVVLVLGLGLHFGIVQPRSAAPNSAVESFLATLHDEHELSKQALLVQYRGQEASYPGWEQQLRQLEQAEAAIYQALREEPDNLELVKLLRQVQDKQIRLIDAVFNPRLGSI